MVSINSQNTIKDRIFKVIRCFNSIQYVTNVNDLLNKKILLNLINNHKGNKSSCGRKAINYTKEFEKHAQQIIQDKFTVNRYLTTTSALEELRMCSKTFYKHYYIYLEKIATVKADQVLCKKLEINPDDINLEHAIQTKRERNFLSVPRFKDSIRIEVIFKQRRLYKNHDVSPELLAIGLTRESLLKKSNCWSKFNYSKFNYSKFSLI